MDTKIVVVRHLGEQNGRYDQPTQRQFPEGLDGGARQEIYSGCMGRVASRSHRCSYKLINVGCMVPARDLDVGEYLKVILHRAACAETVLLTRRLDLTLVHRWCPCLSADRPVVTFAYAMCASTRCSRGRSIASGTGPEAGAQWLGSR